MYVCVFFVLVQCFCKAKTFILFLLPCVCLSSMIVHILYVWQLVVMMIYAVNKFQWSLEKWLRWVLREIYDESLSCDYFYFSMQTITNRCDFNILHVTMQQSWVFFFKYFNTADVCYISMSLHNPKNEIHDRNNMKKEITQQ